MSVIMLTIITAWVVYWIMQVKWEKQDKEFTEFLSQNSRDLLRGSYAEFDGVIYSRDTMLVRYESCCSLFFVSFTRSSCFCLAEKSPDIKALCIVLSLVGGWWGIPWGPIYTIKSVCKTSAAKPISVYELLTDQ